MFLARIEGTLTSTVKHAALAGARFLIARRVDVDGVPFGEPIVVIDSMGAGNGSTVMVTTDGDVMRSAFGNTVPARLSVQGILNSRGEA
jgi:ethanolamine utilization protein EutN